MGEKSGGERSRLFAWRFPWKSGEGWGRGAGGKTEASLGVGGSVSGCTAEAAKRGGLRRASLQLLHLREQGSLSRRKKKAAGERGKRVRLEAVHETFLKSWGGPKGSHLLKIHLSTPLDAGRRKYKGVVFEKVSFPRFAGRGRGRHQDSAGPHLFHRSLSYWCVHLFRLNLASLSLHKKITLVV